jgi:hypothetical protein
MRLSTFDLAWYDQWPVTHAPLDEWSRPGLTNHLGSVQTGGDPTSLRHLVFAPVSGAEESSAFLTLNGTFLAATRVSTAVHWTPWQIRRVATHDAWRIESRLCLPPDRPAALLEITVTNTAPAARDLDLALRLSGRCVNRGPEPWFWGIPRVELTVDALHGQAGLAPGIQFVNTSGLLFSEPAAPASATGPAAHAGRAHGAQILDPAPDSFLRNRDASYRRPALAPGASFTFRLALSQTETPEAAVAVASSVLAAGPAAFAAAESAWRALWRSAFTDTGPLSGRLPDLDLPADLAPVAVSAILCALQLRRTFPLNRGAATYSISTPRRVEACFYPNDWGLAGALLARLDPDATWRQLGLALAGDIRRCNQVNLLTGRSGDASGHPWPYTIDIFNCFYTARELWLAADADPAALSTRRLPTPRGELTLLEVFEDLAFDWRTRRVGALHLADYGPKQELLECVSTYTHVVAALNAAAAWMLHRLAEIYLTLDRPADATAARAEGDAITADILRHLYVPGEGVFRCLRPDGSPGAEVRHCWDFGMVGFCLGQHLPPQVRAEMTSFFRRELLTPTWLRALSPHDADAATSGTRADHQYNGAFGAWPAQCALALLEFGEHALVRDWFAGIARTARQGPFAQAHYDEAAIPPEHGGAAKVTDEMPQGCHWANLSGGLFWAAVDKLAATSPRIQ